MEVILPLLVGLLFAASIFMMLRPQLMRVALGIILLTNASNLFLFLVGRLSKEGPPVIPTNSDKLLKDYANPVSQALILTAIVIGFSLLSFVIALVYRSVKDFDSQNPDVIALEKTEEE